MPQISTKSFVVNNLKRINGKRIAWLPVFYVFVRNLKEAFKIALFLRKMRFSFGKQVSLSWFENEYGFEINDLFKMKKNLYKKSTHFMVFGKIPKIENPPTWWRRIFWGDWRGSNPRLSGPQPDALTDWATTSVYWVIKLRQK